jgi:hypothetical protein
MDTICAYEAENSLVTNAKRKKMVEKACGVFLANAMANKGDGILHDPLPELIWKDSIHEAEAYIRKNDGESENWVTEEEMNYWPKMFEIVKLTRNRELDEDEDEDYFSLQQFTADQELLAWAGATLYTNCQAFYPFTKQTILVLK